MGGREAGVAEAHQQGHEPGAHHAVAEVFEAHGGHQGGQPTAEAGQGGIAQIAGSPDHGKHPEAAVEPQPGKQHPAHHRAGHGGGDGPATIEQADLGIAEARLFEKGDGEGRQQSVGPAVQQHQQHQPG
ncbi:MAG: hypothetical protein EB136_10130, partial [Synechococcaceae bacterium WBB_3_034]|nr:hypothetical protein [Synechococcaceae bacterium WBB_3_034]